MRHSFHVFAVFSYLFTTTFAVPSLSPRYSTYTLPSLNRPVKAAPASPEEMRAVKQWWRQESDELAKTLKLTMQFSYLGVFWGIFVPSEHSTKTVVYWTVQCNTCKWTSKETEAFDQAVAGTSGIFKGGIIPSNLEEYSAGDRENGIYTFTTYYGFKSTWAAERPVGPLKLYAASQKYWTAVKALVIEMEETRLANAKSTEPKEAEAARKTAQKARQILNGLGKIAWNEPEVKEKTNGDPVDPSWQAAMNKIGNEPPAKQAAGHVAARLKQ